MNRDSEDYIKNLFENISIVEEINLLAEDTLGKWFSEIQNISSFEETERLFDNIEALQWKLAYLLFQEKLNLSEKLRTFVYDYDRIELPLERKKAFLKIKNLKSL